MEKIGLIFGKRIELITGETATRNSLRVRTFSPVVTGRTASRVTQSYVYGVSSDLDKRS